MDIKKEAVEFAVQRHPEEAVRLRATLREFEEFAEAWDVRRDGFLPDGDPRGFEGRFRALGAVGVEVVETAETFAQNYLRSM